MTTTLCAVPYRVTEHDNQIMFKDDSGFCGYESVFSMEWRGTGWYLIDTENTFAKIYVPHIVAAYEWLEKNYIKHYYDGVATVECIYKE